MVDVLRLTAYYYLLRHTATYFDVLGFTPMPYCIHTHALSWLKTYDLRLTDSSLVRASCYAHYATHHLLHNLGRSLDSTTTASYNGAAMRGALGRLSCDAPWARAHVLRDAAPGRACGRTCWDSRAEMATGSTWLDCVCCGHSRDFWERVCSDETFSTRHGAPTQSRRPHTWRATIDRDRPPPG